MASPDATIAALQEQVAREKATSRENLKKVLAAGKEKKDAEAQLAAVTLQLQQLQASGGGAGGADVAAIQEELDAAKEEALYWQDEAEASAAQLESARAQLQRQAQQAAPAPAQAAAGPPPHLQMLALRPSELQRKGAAPRR